MTELLHNKSISINRADHLVTVRVNGGTAQLQYRVGGLDMADLPDSSYTVDTDEIKTLCQCRLRAILTGGATVHINEAGGSS